jgi:anti-sigma factor RsiW
VNCDQLLERASEIVDGGLAPAMRADVDGHLSSCARCRALIADLRLVRQTAATLDRALPPADLWHRIASHLQAEPGFTRHEPRPLGVRLSPQPAGRERRTPAWAWIAAAAVLVLAVGGGIWFMTRSMQRAATTVAGGGATTSPGNTNPHALVESIDAELQLAAEHYEKAIAGLEQVANQSDSPLDPELTGTLRKNLLLIDRAIEESRLALKAEPENTVAQESLFEAFRRKIALLQDTIALMNEMRKGNEAGAARIVEGLNKS